MLATQTLAKIQLVVFDFDGVFTDNFVYVNQDGSESVRCLRSDGLGLSRLENIGVHLLIVSTESNPVVTTRANKLKIKCLQGVKDKALAIKSICHEMDIELAHVVFVGNDINDIPAFKLVGFPVGVADAYPEVLPYIKIQTHNKGGCGAVREICDRIFEAKHDLKSKIFQ